MSKRIRIDDAARQELRAAARWYEEQRRGLGQGLVDAIDEAMSRVARLGPDCRPVFGVDPELGVRRVRAKRSPTRSCSSNYRRPSESSRSCTNADAQDTGKIG